MKKLVFFILVLLLVRGVTFSAFGANGRLLQYENLLMGTEIGNTGNLNQVLAVLVGPQGRAGAAGVAGKNGFVGLTEPQEKMELLAHQVLLAQVVHRDYKHLQEQQVVTERKDLQDQQVVTERKELRVHPVLAVAVRLQLFHLHLVIPIVHLEVQSSSQPMAHNLLHAMARKEMFHLVQALEKSTSAMMLLTLE